MIKKSKEIKRKPSNERMEHQYFDVDNQVYYESNSDKIYEIAQAVDSNGDEIQLKIEDINWFVDSTSLSVGEDQDCSNIDGEEGNE
jgi:hypothetical protein|tara:strand:+ start:2576 stop:2833 length:258 start_codon:yes stop_codon:yes gene_type:complete